ncbi:MAG: ABC transporter ATP-binding protein [Chloroflexota bacterium]
MANGIESAAIWSVSQLGEVVEALIDISTGQSIPNSVSLPAVALPNDDEHSIAEWLTRSADRYGWETEAIHASYSDLDSLLRSVGPALLRLPQTEDEPSPGFLALLHGGRQYVTLIQPDRTKIRILLTTLRDILSAKATQPYTDALSRVLKRSTIIKDRDAKVRHSLLAEMLGPTPVILCWSLCPSPETPLYTQARQIHFPYFGWLLGGATIAQLTLTLLSWWMIGTGALAGHFDWGWLWGWGLLVLSIMPFQILAHYAQSSLVIGLGRLFKERLLYGILQLRSDAVRLEGAGHFLGRVFAADALEQLALAGGFFTLLAIVQLFVAVTVLVWGAGGWPHAILLGFWIAVMFVLGWRAYVHDKRIHHSRRTLTNDLVERMVGHRTRLAQEHQANWHDAEDRDLSNYQKQLQQTDSASSRLKAFVPRGWMMVGLLWFFYVLLIGEHSPSQLAISLGGVLFARQAFITIVMGMQSVIGASLAWADVKPLLGAALPKPAGTGTELFLNGIQSEKVQQPILTLHNVSFRYPTRNREILTSCHIKIHRGERLLLEGPSGAGKSTLVNLMTSLQKPDSGSMLLHGTEQQAIPEGIWRQRIVAVPQFHENHVLNGSLAFNLLLGSKWPATDQGLARAEEVCRSLGLGELLNRMPGGLQQIVGESGWQLSHGERSRLYIARAILQDADLIILDESFGALDPESLSETLQAVLAQVSTLLVVAHP